MISLYLHAQSALKTPQTLYIRLNTYKSEMLCPNYVFYRQIIPTLRLTNNNTNRGLVSLIGDSIIIMEMLWLKYSL